jgi:hypothetical protein
MHGKTSNAASKQNRIIKATTPPKIPIAGILEIINAPNTPQIIAAAANNAFPTQNIDVLIDFLGFSAHIFRSSSYRRARWIEKSTPTPMINDEVNSVMGFRGMLNT